MSGLCQCGCGTEVSPSRQGDTKRGYIKGQPVKRPAKPALSSDAAMWPDDATLGEYRAAWGAYHAAEKKWKQRQERLPSAMYYRFEVGYIGGVGGITFNHIMGSGDTWEEALQKAGALPKAALV